MRRILKNRRPAFEDAAPVVVKRTIPKIMQRPVQQPKPPQKKSNGTKVQYRDRQDYKPTLPPEVFAVYEALHDRWPDIFNIKNPVPLERGVREKIIASKWFQNNDIDEMSIRRCLGWYVKRVEYRKAILNNRHRITLVGSIGEKITGDEREHALLEIRKFRKWRDEQNEKQRQEKEKGNTNANPR